MHRFLTTAAFAALAACSGPTDRLDYSSLDSRLSLNAFVATAMVRTKSIG